MASFRGSNPGPWPIGRSTSRAGASRNATVFIWCCAASSIWHYTASSPEISRYLLHDGALVTAPTILNISPVRLFPHCMSPVDPEDFRSFADERFIGQSLPARNSMSFGRVDGPRPKRCRH